MRKYFGILSGILLAVSVVQSQTIDSGRVYMQLAGTALSKQDYRVAVDYYRSALRFRPDHAGATYNIACSYSLLNEKKEALKWLGKAVDLGLYRFDDDEDLDNIRSTKEYEKLRVRAAKLLEEMKGGVFEPVVILPDPFDSTRRYPLLLAMHGYGSNPNDFARALKNIPTQTGFILCCPYGPDVLGKTSFGWGEWDDGEGRVREDLELMKERFRVDTSRVILLGFSQGGTFAYYLGLKRSAVFEGVISIAGVYDSTFNRYLPDVSGARPRFFIMLGEDEPERRIKGNIDAIRQLISCGITLSFNAYAGYGHVIPGDVDLEIKRAIEWIEKK